MHLAPGAGLTSCALDSFANLCVLYTQSHKWCSRLEGWLAGGCSATDTCHWWGNQTLLWWEAQLSSVCDVQARACSPPSVRAERWWSDPKPGVRSHLHTHTQSDIWRIWETDTDTKVQMTLFSAVCYSEDKNRPDSGGGCPSSTRCVLDDGSESETLWEDLQFFLWTESNGSCTKNKTKKKVIFNITCCRPFKFDQDHI